MFAKSLILALLALSISVEAVPQANRNRFNNGNRFNNKGNKPATSCAAPKTVTALQTVTVTARGNVATPVATSRPNTGNNNGGGNNATGGNNGGNNNGGNKGGNNNTGGNNNAGGNNNTGGNNNNGGNGNNGGNNNGGNGNPQTSLTLNPAVIAAGFANNGQDVPTAGQVASLTSTNNFINFCLTRPDLPITNGKQITTGSCNPAPIGLIPSTDNMPSSKFQFPQNFATIKAGQTFTIQMRIANMQTGAFVNAQENYFAAPQQLNGAGQIIGHSHVVVEQLTSLAQTTPTDPKKFAFFKGLNAAAVNGILTADVTGGLSAGVYKLSSINTAANHQPAIVPVAQHGSLDDAIYFTVTNDGQAANNGNNANGNNGNNGNNGGKNNGGANIAPTTTAKAAAPAATTSKKNGQKRRALNRL